MSGIFSKLYSGRKKDIYYERDMSPDKSKKLNKNIKENLDTVHDYLYDCDDVITREFYMGAAQKHEMALMYIDGLADKNLVQEEILKSLMLFTRQAPMEYTLGQNFFNMVKEGLLTVADVRETDNFGEVILAILSGDTVLFLDKFEKALIISTRGWEKRGVEEPSTEAVIRGPRDGFTETYRVNIALVRRRIKDTNLKVKTVKLGRHTRTDVGIMFIKGIAKPSIVDEVLKRLETIDVSGVLESGYIEQMIEDNWLSPFPQFRRTERPDVVAAGLMEGNVAIICDNTPFALLVPATFFSLFQSPEDFYERWYIASMIRLLRFGAAFFAYTFPGLYVAMTAYHPGMLPTDLALSIAATREGVPFSAVVEALIMVFSLEVLREAGVRLPGPIGQTIGIVGGLVVGEAAVRAGIVSPIMVIVVAVNAISSFAIPNYSVAIGFRLLTFVFIFLAAVAGLYGIMVGILALMIHLVTLKSFGAHYLSPYVSFRWSEGKDFIVRGPMPSMEVRPGYTRPEDLNRMNDRRKDNQETAGDENADK
ncbi:spore germination protein [Thermoanaerobacterium sp. DL9XJH110]|jgi:spore germination protein|uniref:spore germination protein n=1 Tax=Thermoanaerobacterium sp. DL9XJH110 TaxID=3386643 RepID=UPI003BB7287F